MSKILPTPNQKAQNRYYILLILVVTSLGLSGFDFLDIGGNAVLLPHRLFIGLLVLYFFSVIFISSQINLNWLDIAVLSFLGVMLARFLLETTQPYPLVQSITILVQLVFVVALYFAIGSYPVNRREIRILLRLWLISVLIISLYGFYQIFARNLGLPLANLSFGAFQTKGAYLFGFQRPTSIFSEPTHYSGYVLPAYVFFTILSFKGYATSVLFNEYKWNLVILTFFWINYFFIASLGGFTAVAATIGVAVIFHPEYYRSAVTLGLTFALSIFLIFNFGDSLSLIYAPAYRIVHLVTSLTGLIIGDGQVSGSIGVRITRFYWAIEVWARHPLFGIGINNIIYESALSLPGWYSGRSPLSPVTHSIIGLLLSSVGLVGTIAYTWIYVLGYKHLQNAMELLNDSFYQSVVLGIGYAVVVNFFNGFFSISLINAQSWFLFGMISMLVSYGHQHPEKK